MPGQSSEEAAELVATIRGEHVVMKNWFMGPTQAAKELRDKYGPYPGLWKEVLNWPGWKEARKAYLKFTQAGESGASAPSANGSSTGDIPRKRRSRWGTVDDSNNNEGASNGGSSSSAGAEGEPPNKQRRSRWGRDDPQSTSAPPAPAAPYQRPSLVPPSMKPLPGLGLPGMPQNLTPQQQQEFARHQARLREINTKLDNLEAEAARVDALPRGHRDRSPSPPPGTLLMCDLGVLIVFELHIANSRLSNTHYSLSPTILLFCFFAVSVRYGWKTQKYSRCSMATTILCGTPRHFGEIDEFEPCCSLFWIV